MKRPSLDEYYLNIAKAVSMRSTCLKKHYGAVIVKNGEIISTGYNNPPRGEAHCVTCSKTCVRDGDVGEFTSCPAVHAEQNAIIQAASMGHAIEGGTIYITHQPCVICAKCHY